MKILEQLKDFNSLSLIPTNLNGFGEAFRELFFDQKQGRGCYASFDLNSFITPLESRWAEDPLEWTRACYTSKNYLIYVVMEYIWDGDGTLVFQFPNYDHCLVNSDCKKDYTWEWLKYSEVLTWYNGD